MPLAAVAYLVGTVASSGDAVATLTGTVEGGTALATLEGTVERNRVNAYEATCIRTGFRVKLNGEWVPDAELVDYKLTESLDTPVSFFDFNVVGSRYSMLSSLDSWTLVPIELYTYNGPPGREIEELRFAGYVRPGAASASSPPAGPGALVSIRATSRMGRAGEHELCHEQPPLTGKRRGTIAAELCADVGLTATDFPAGAVYSKGIEAKGTRLLAYLVPFVEPEGWKLRERPRAFADGGPVLGVVTPRLKEPPLPPDAIWDCSRVGSFKIEGPEGAASRYIVRGFGAVFVDELGQTTRRTVTEVIAPYAPKVALDFQDSTGAVNPTGASPNEAAPRVVQRIVDTLISRGDKPLTQQVEEQVYFNPRAAHSVTIGGAFAYRDVLIQEDGQYVRLPEELLMTVTRSKVRFDYDEDQNSIGSQTLDWIWRALPKGISIAGEATISIDNAYIFGDSNSYSTPFEEFAWNSQHDETRQFAESGAELEVAIESSGYVAVRSLVGDHEANVYPGYYVRSDGKGQTEAVAGWHTYGRRVTRNSIVDGTLAGTTELLFGLATWAMVPGAGVYSWGEFDSNSKEEVFRFTHSESRNFRVLSSDAYEETIRRPNEPPKVEPRSGRVPQPRHRSSPWTYLRQEPIELVVDDATIEELLGFRREVIQNDHVQNLDEARRVAAMRRAERACFTVTLSRHEALQRVGDTVLLVSPDHACLHRSLLWESTTHRSRVKPAQTADYLLRIPL